MPPIPHPILDEIATAVPCERLLELRGIALQRSGEGWMCCCPLPGHDDRTPSFHVNLKDGRSLFHCFGCNRSGNQFQLMQALEDCDFPTAAGLLAKIAGMDLEAALRAAKEKPSASPSLPPLPLDPAATGSALDAQMVAFAHACLQRPDSPGRAYLGKRGVLDEALIGTGLGFFPQKELGRILEAHRLDKQRKDGQRLRQALVAGGWYNKATGHPTMDGRVVVPIYAEDGRTLAQCYGRMVSEPARDDQHRHRHLSRPSVVVWNRAGLVNADGAALVCEAAFDAFSFWVAGLRHVTFGLGVHGVGEPHFVVLKAAEARDVFVAFDNDDPGNKAAEPLSRCLMAEGFAVYRVRVPAALKDVNALAVDAGAAAPAVLADLIRAAEWVGGSRPVPVLPFSPPETPAPAEIARPAAAPIAPAPVPAAAAAPAAPALQEDGPDLHLALGERRYRIRGLDRNRSLDVLKVNVRLDAATPQGERFHVDTLDLYQLPQRQRFITAAAEETGLPAETFKADIGRLLSLLECRQTERARAAAPAAAEAAEADPAASMTPEEHAAGLALLRAPDLMARIDADLGTWIVNERENRMVGYLALTSRLLRTPLAVVIQSSSAAGKSALMDALLAFMPPEAVRRYSALSGRSLFYLGTANLKHRVLAIAEEEGACRASYALKLLQSEGYLSMAATGKDPESGRLTTHEYRVEGPVMLLLTTTAVDVDAELLNRCLVLSVDEGPAQTAAILAAQRRARTLGGIAVQDERAAVARLHQNAQRLLRPLAVINRFDKTLVFDTNLTRLRRDHAKYLALIDAIALLHQYQRPVQEYRCADGRMMPYIEVEPSDIQLANGLMRAVLSRSLDELPPQTRTLWERLASYVQERSARETVAPEQVRFTRREVQALTSWSYKQARVHLDRLFADEWLVRGEGGQGKLAWYALAPGLAGTALARQPVPMLSDAQGNLVCTLPDAEGLRTPRSESTLGTLPTLCPDFAQGERAKLAGGISREIPASEGTLPTFPDFTYQAPRGDGHRIVDGPSKAGVQEAGDRVVQPSLIDLRRPQIGAGCTLSSSAPSVTDPTAAPAPDRGCGSLSLAAPAGHNGTKVGSEALAGGKTVSLSPLAVPPGTEGVPGSGTAAPDAAA